MEARGRSCGIWCEIMFGCFVCVHRRHCSCSCCVVVDENHSWQGFELPKEEFTIQFINNTNWNYRCCVSGERVWRELLAGTLHAGIVSARRRYRRTTRKRITCRLFLNNLKRREHSYFTPNGVHSQCALSIPMYLGTLNWASWNWNILPRSKTLPMPKANNSTNNFRQICDMGPNRFHPSNGSGRFRITKPSKPRAGNNNIIKYHTYLSLSG